MKKIFYVLCIVLLIASCQKSESNNSTTSTNTTNQCPTAPTSTFKYKIDGTLIECNGSLSEKSGEGSLIRKEQKNASSSTALSNSNYVFSIHATKNYFYGDDGEPIIEIEINSTSLTPSSYTSSNNGIRLVRIFYPTQSVYCDNTICTSSFYTGQDFTLTVSKVENGYADGTFSGKLKKESSTGFNIITEGEFKNVKILQ
jgi:hypothetical protein